MSMGNLNLSLIDRINENSKLYPEVDALKKILSENGVDFEKRTIDVNKLAQYVKSTSKNGILMPTKEDIICKVYLSQILFPQRDNNKINYLFGKGIGIEIAILGRCIGRTRNDIKIEPRSHSDFEIYDAKETNPYDNYQEFVDVFMAQEYFPPTKTKGLNNIPETLLDDTHEVVDFYGLPILVPCLEILYVDKFLKRESTPREFGFDYEALSSQYTLDIEKCKKIFKTLYAQAEIESIKRSQIPFEELVQRIELFIKNSPEEILESFNSIAKRNMNTSYMGIPMAIVKYVGVDILVDGKISQEYLEKLRLQYDTYYESKLAEINSKYEDMIRDLSGKNFRNDNSPDYIL